jgi:hypothetical protein
MGLGDILDGIFKLLKANFRTIAVIVASLIVPFQIVLAFLERDIGGGHGVLQIINDPSVAASTNSSLSTELIRFGIEGVDILMLPFVGGAIATVVAASYLGQEIGPGEALRATARRFWSLFGAWWIHLGGEIVGIICCGVGLIPAMALFMMIAPAVVTEDLGAVAGVRRSWSLARRRFWPTVGTLLVVGLMASFLSSVIGLAPDSLALYLGLHWGWLLLALGGALTALIVTPIAGITATLVYFDSRIRSEAFDLQVIAAGLARSGA